MSKYFLTDGHSLRSFGQFNDDADAVNAHKVLKQFTAHNYDLLCIEDDLCRAHDADTDAWLNVEYKTILGSIGLPCPKITREMLEEHPVMVAAMEHISDLESKLDDNELSLQRAFEDIDCYYSPFDPDDHMPD